MNPAEFIIAFRRGQRAPAYFFRGPDRFLHEECRKVLVAAVPSETREWCLETIEFEPGQLEKELQAAQQMPMLGGHSYLLISDSDDFKRATDTDAEALRQYLENPSPFATVAFIAVEPDRRRRFTQWLEKKAQVVEMRPLKKREASGWAKGFLHERGVEADLALVEEIAAKFEVTSDREPEKAGVNLLWMRTELEKLLTAKPGAKHLERSDLEFIVGFREEHQIGRFLYALAERNCAEALELLQSLLASKTAGTLLVWCLGDLFRQALKVQAEPAGFSGSGARGYGRKFGGWGRAGNPFSTLEVARLMLKKYSQPELLQALKLVRQTDLGVKSSWKDAGLLLEFLVWQVVTGKGSASGEELDEGVSSTSAE